MKLKAERVPLSKRIRFEIFKRDGFVCQYCGKRPPDTTLEVDHIEPVCLGGINEPINLITACLKCNRGKGGKSLGERIIRPDLDAELLQAQQEIAEAKIFIKTQAELSKSRMQLVGVIQQHWKEILRTTNEQDQFIYPSGSTIIEWLRRYDAREITEAIERLLPAQRRQPWRFNKLENYLSYVGGILRNQREDRDGR